MLNSLSSFPVLSLQWGAVAGASLVAAAIDVRSRRIPNWLTGSLFLAGLIWAGCTAGFHGLAEGFCAAVLLALPYIILFVIAGGGAADAKLMGALGAWLGLVNGCTVLLAVCLAGAVLGIGYAIIKGEARAVLINMILICTGLGSFLTGRKRWSEAMELLPNPQNMLKIPYGVAIFAGVALAAGAIGFRKTLVGI